MEKMTSIQVSKDIKDQLKIIVANNKLKSYNELLKQIIGQINGI